MKKNVKILLLLLPIITITFWACRKDFSNESKSKDPIVVAKNWFNNKYAQETKIRKDGKLVTGTKYPDWRIIKKYTYGGVLVFETPLLENNKKLLMFKKEGVESVFKEITSIRKYLIFNKNNGYKDIIQTVIATEAYLNKGYDISTISINNIPADFSGALLFHSFQEDFIKGYLYNNGKVIKFLKPYKSNTNSRDIIPHDKPFSFSTNCQTCEGIFNDQTDLVYEGTFACEDIFPIPASCSDEDYEEEDLPGEGLCGTTPNPFNCPCDNGVLDMGTCIDNGGLGGGGVNCNGLTNVDSDCDQLPPFTWSFTRDNGESFIDNNPTLQPDFQFDPADNAQTNYPKFYAIEKTLNLL